MTTLMERNRERIARVRAENSAREYRNIQREQRRATPRGSRRLDPSEYEVFGLPAPCETIKQTNPVHFVQVSEPKPGLREFFIRRVKGSEYAWYENMKQAIYD